MRSTTLFMRTLMLAGVLSVAAASAHAACADDIAPQPEKGSWKSPKARAVAPADSATEGSTAEVLTPQAQLQLIAREAAKRSALVGAAKLLADAAAYDIEETRGATLPQISMNGTLGPAYSRYAGETLKKGSQITGTLNASGVIYDGGRLNALTQYRREMAGAAQYGLQATREQVVLEAVSTALERNRYRTQAKVYQQYARKMSCLVEALEQIVEVDRGRASELVQARKTQAQAELARDNALTTSRQVEIRLRKLVGDQANIGEGIAGPLTQTMEAGEIIRLLEQSNEMQQMRLQAEGAMRYAESVEAGQKPQVSWVANSTGGVQGDTKSLAVQGGLSVSYNLFNGGSDKAASAAAARRAEAARRQYEETLNTKTSRAFEVQELASGAFDRARRYVDVLKDSERVRNSTFQQWSQLGKRSLFDVMSAEGDHFNLRVAYVNALHDGYQANAQLRSMGGGLMRWLGVEER